MTRPQEQVYVRSESGIFLCFPQQLHNWLEGYHLSTLTRYFPLSVSLYSSRFRNIPYPLSSVAFPFPKALLDIALMLRDSTHTMSY